MNAIVNLGNPRKEMTVVADAVLERHSTKSLKLTGIEVYQGDSFLLTSPAYGAGMTLDCLEEMTMSGMIGDEDAIIFVGSMGSLSLRIKLSDTVLPNPLGCAYYGFDGVWLEQDRVLLKALRDVITKRDIEAVEFRHGSSLAVFDPHTDHVTYTCSLYRDDVLGVDCGEVFVGIQFTSTHGMRGGAILYCSDSPDVHIASVGAAEFARRAAEADLLLNEIAAEILIAT